MAGSSSTTRIFPFLPVRMASLRFDPRCNPRDSSGESRFRPREPPPKSARRLGRIRQQQLRNTVFQDILIATRFGFRSGDNGVTMIQLSRSDQRHDATEGVVGLRSLRALVVDDNHDAADSLAWLLRLAGHQVWTAYDG